MSIYQQQNQVPKAEPYRQYWAERTKYARLNPLAPPDWEERQPQGVWDNEVPSFLGPGIAPLSGYEKGCKRLHYGRPSVAVWYFEQGLINEISLFDRFDTPKALRYYQMLAKAYRQKAELFKSDKWTVYVSDESKRRKAEAAVREYLKEHRAVEVPEAEQLAEHYRLKAMIVEARLAEKKRKLGQPEVTPTNAVPPSTKVPSPSK